MCRGTQEAVWQAQNEPIECPSEHEVDRESCQTFINTVHTQNRMFFFIGQHFLIHLDGLGTLRTRSGSIAEPVWARLEFPFRTEFEVVFLVDFRSLQGTRNVLC